MLSRRFMKMFYVLLLGAVLGVAIQPAAAQELKGVTRARTVTKATSQRTIPAGQKVTLVGNVTKVENDTFSVCDMNGAETVVIVSPDTKITTHRRGIFRGAETLDKGALLIGLNVQVRGRGNDSGQLAASWVKFHYSDLRSATQLDTRAIPIEAEQVRQGEQLEETAGVASTALTTAKAAQDSADKAQATADTARNDAAAAQNAAAAAQARIGTLDDFEASDSLMVNFHAGSAKLTEEAKTKLNEFATKTLNAKGYVIEIAGYASAEGGLNYNDDLSARRAEAVQDYLIGFCNVPVRRFITPYSGGELNPIADNKTVAGRQQNRRVEVKMLVSKGLAGKEQVAVQASDK
jgi:outer membrane protein OmpA-like peptidoglycan-associated protein